MATRPETASDVTGTGPEARRPARARTALSIAGIVIGVIGLVVSVVGVAGQLLPRQFTVAQQRKIMGWEVGKRWQEFPAGKVFAASIAYRPPAALDDVDSSSLRLGAHRAGIARLASCPAATDQAVASVLSRTGCEAVLRATYVDNTDSYAVTVGVAVFPTAAKAAAAQRQLAAPSLTKRHPAPGVRAVAFPGTPAAGFYDSRRQLSVSTGGPVGSYVVMYTAGYADDRPRVPVTADSYGDAEMTSVAAGVAESVASVLNAPPAPPRCPGAPGC
ncbi:MAG TPA: hypothetical protein VG164_09380 [Trebonia sp.]|nr:hypothetical protein [Trebonia sp.]